MIYGFITNEKQPPEHKEYTYKGRSKKQYIGSEETSETNTQHIDRKGT